jgi:hypothetical protein
VLPRVRVARITVRHRDGMLDGALKGAIGGGAVCAVSCGQGLDRAGQLPAAVAAAAGIWALIGAGVDFLQREERVLYLRAPSF